MSSSESSLASLQRFQKYQSSTAGSSSVNKIILFYFIFKDIDKFDKKLLRRNEVDEEVRRKVAYHFQGFYTKRKSMSNIITTFLCF